MVHTLFIDFPNMKSERIWMNISLNKKRKKERKENNNLVSLKTLFSIQHWKVFFNHWPSKTFNILIYIQKQQDIEASVFQNMIWFRSSVNYKFFKGKKYIFAFFWLCLKNIEILLLIWRKSTFLILAFEMSCNSLAFFDSAINYWSSARHISKCWTYGSEQCSQSVRFYISSERDRQKINM